MELKFNLSLFLFFLSFNLINAQNIGIGTPNPTVKLDINNNGATGAKVQVKGSDGVNATWRLATPSNQVVAFGGNSDHNVDFGYFNNANTTFTPRMRIERNTGDVGIGTVAPRNKLDVNGYVTFGNQTSGGVDVEGSVRYNTTKKCMEFHNGNGWRCMGQPTIQRITVRDQNNESYRGTGCNSCTGWGGGYGAQYSFTVNDLIAGQQIMFIAEVFFDNDTKKNNSWANATKISGNGYWSEIEVNSTGTESQQTKIFATGTVNATGNLSFVFESNTGLTDVRITAIAF